MCQPSAPEEVGQPLPLGYIRTSLPPPGELPPFSLLYRCTSQPLPFSSSTVGLNSEAMNAGIYVFVLLAAFASSSLGRPSHSPNPNLSQADPPKLDSALSTHTRQIRSPLPAGELAPYSKPNEEDVSRASFNQILARLISRKGGFQPPRSMSVSSRASGPGPNHRIKDRDYLGWMDFGRRSAEEYEYSS